MKPKKPRPINKNLFTAGFYTDQIVIHSYINLDARPVKDLKQLRAWLDKAIKWMEGGK